MSQQINLFNPIFLKEKKYFSAVTMAQALLLIVVGVLLLFFYSMYQSRSLKEDAQKTAAKLVTVQQQLAKMNAEYGARKKNQSLEDGVKIAVEELAALQQTMARLQNDEFGNRKGYSAYLRAFSRQIVDGLWLTGFSIESGGNAIALQGRALQPELVPAYINRLSQEAVIQGKSFATLEIQQPAERKAQEGGAVAATVEQKKSDVVAFIEFDLRSAGLEKTASKSSASASTAKSASEPAAQSGAKKQ